MKPETPRFAVVGHPNKGKSSIVSTLSEDDSVQISSIPGTTVKSREFPMRVGDELLYVLIDTPGFQRARRALAWMQERETDAASRPGIVKDFVLNFQDTDEFQDECELLAPLVTGAGILYVVDGSAPYGPEYEAEMEVLRWTGRPSMALINMIGDGDFASQWQDALGQYFRIVRVFNALHEDFDKRLELLRAFGQLDERWREPLERAVRGLNSDRQRRRDRGSRYIAELLYDILTISETRKIGPLDDPEDFKESLLEKFKQSLLNREAACRDRIESLYAYHKLERDEENLELFDEDLFSEQTWLLWGLNRTQLIATGAVGGAAIGAGIDLAVGGADLMLGTVIGTLVGGASAVYSSDKLAEVKVLGLPLGGNELKAGPTKNINFPYVLLGRALHHHAVIASRTHAQRDALVIERDTDSFTLRNMTDDLRKSFEKQFVAIRRNSEDGGAESATRDLADLVRRAMVEAESAVGSTN